MINYRTSSFHLFINLAKKAFFIIAIINFFHLTVNAQTISFFKEKDIDSTYNYYANPIILSNNNIVLIENYAYAATQNSGYLFTSYNSLGEVDFSKKIVFNSLFVFGPVTTYKSSDNFIYSIALVGNPKDSCYYNQIIKFDEFGDTVFTKMLKCKTFQNYISITETNEGVIAFYGSEVIGMGVISRGILMLMEKDGTIILRNKNTTNFDFCTGRSIIALENGGFLVTGTVNDFNSLYTNEYNFLGLSIYVERIDGYGAVIWKKIIGTLYLDEIPSSIIKLKNEDAFLISGSGQKVDNSVGYNNHVSVGITLKIKESGEMVWLTNLSEFNTNTLMTIQQANGTYLSLIETAKTLRITTLSELGDSIHNFQLKLPTLDHLYASGFKQYDDCNLFISSTSNLYSANPNAVFIKINLANCPLIDPLEADKILFFPNPIQDHLQINVGNDYLKSTLEIYNNIGQLLMTTNISTTFSSFDFTGFPAGMYFCKISNPKGITKTYSLVKANK